MNVMLVASTPPSWPNLWTWLERIDGGSVRAWQEASGTEEMELAIVAEATQAVESMRDLPWERVAVMVERSYRLLVGVDDDREEEMRLATVAVDQEMELEVGGRGIE